MLSAVLRRIGSHRWLILSAAVVSTAFGMTSTATRTSHAEEPVADGPWISSVKWLSNDVLVGTHSEGLLLRPGSLVTANVNALSELKTLGEAETSLWDVVVLGEGRVVASDYKGGVALYADAGTEPLELQSRWVRCLSKTPTPNEILAGAEDGKLLLLSTTDKKELRRIEVGTAAIFEIVFNPAGTEIAVASGDGSISLYNWPALELQRKIAGRGEAVWSVMYSADGTQLVSGGADRRLRLWNVATGQSIVSIANTPDWVTSLTPLPNSTLFVAGCMNGKCVVADYQTMLPVATYDGPGSAIWDMELAEDGARLAIATRKNGWSVVDIGPWLADGKSAAELASQDKAPQP